MTLFVAGETPPFFALSFGIWFLVLSGADSASSFVSVVQVAGTVGSSVHYIGVNLWHFDSQDLGPLLQSKSANIVQFLLVAETLLGDFITDSLDVLDCDVVLVVLTDSFLPSMEVMGSDHLQDMVHHLVG